MNIVSMREKRKKKGNENDNGIVGAKDKKRNIYMP
jgi:hypothetical protein